MTRDDLFNVSVILFDALFLTRPVDECFHRS
jgi:hypothetical protein